MGNKVTWIFEAVDKFTSVGRKINNQVREQAKSVRALSQRLRENAQRAKESTATLKKMGQTAINVGKDLTLKLTGGIIALGTAAVAQAAKFETLQVTFNTLLGSAERAGKLLSELTTFAAKTPFQLGEITESARLLLAFGEGADTVTDSLRRMGDLAAATGRPLKEFALVFGQIRVKGRLMGEEVMQLAERGVAIIPEIAKTFGVSVQKVQEAVTAGQVPFEVVEKTLRRMTSEGGRFYNLTAQQAETLGGLWSTLLDTIQMFLKDLGGILVEHLELKDLLKDIISGLDVMRKKAKEFVANNPGWTKFILIVVGILAVLGPALLIFGKLLMAIIAIKIGLPIVAAAFSAFGAAVLGAVPALLSMAAAGWAAIAPALPFIAAVVGIIAAISALVAAGIWLIDNWDFVIAKFKELTSLIANFDFQGIKSFFGFGGEISTSNSSKTAIDVNVKAPPNTVDKISTKTVGSVPGLNLGVNMVTGL